MVDHDPVLQKFRAAIAEIYGERIERVVLYGSRARGDAKPDSDYDIAVFLKDLSNRWQEVRRIVDIEFAILDDTGAVVHAIPCRKLARPGLALNVQDQARRPRLMKSANSRLLCQCG